ncbi:hypothetical protein SAMN04488065_0399 [Haloplanus vescus]|uniref:DUF5305 domain-containing protein n=1 Tax=Haloplanus vescus TaxID=555874 RepID=A0A1H3VYJ6_9EURY|nr:hypothetical protein SAMN04488065_0399 [Haloplanus vescus]
MPMGGDRNGRRRAVIDEWFWVIALVAVVIAGIGGYAAYTAHATPGTVTEERQVSSWEGNGSYTTAATVSEPNPLYAQGTELSDRPAYFMAVSPRLDGTFAFEYQASGGGTADVAVQQTLVIRSVGGDGDEATTEYWRIEESLGGTTASGVASGEAVQTTFSRNVSQIAVRASNISERLGGTPGSVQIMVVNTVALDGEVNGQQVERTATYRLPIGIEGSTYSPAATEGQAMTGSTTETLTRQRTYGPLWTVGGPVLLVLGLAGVAGLAYGRYDDRFTVSEAERNRLDFESTRDEFDDWITTARLPSTVLNRPRVDVDSLDGLVDTAIDVDARVFERPDGEAFYVPHEGLLYVYEAPTPRLDAMLDEDGEGDEADD